MSITVTVVIDHCGMCRHKKHDRAIDKPRCTHMDYNNSEIPLLNKALWEDVPIPQWCPLRSGSMY